jgi:hypothetical protein
MFAAVLVPFSAWRAMFRCATFRLESYADAVFFSEFTDALADLHERPEVMELQVAHERAESAVLTRIMGIAKPSHKKDAPCCPARG